MKGFAKLSRKIWFVLSFGVQRKPGDKAPYSDRFLVDLIGMQLIDRCSQMHGPQRVSCVLNKIDEFK